MASAYSDNGSHANPCRPTVNIPKGENWQTKTETGKKKVV